MHLIDKKRGNIIIIISLILNFYFVMLRSLVGSEMCIRDRFDLDEEIKYSAVQREIDAHTFEESQSPYSDAYNTDTFGSSHGTAIPKSYPDVFRSNFIDEAYVSPTCSSVVWNSSVNVLFGTMF